MAGTIDVKSPAFTESQTISTEYTCDSADASPELHIGSVLDGTKSLAILVEDPDALQETYTQWILFNIPPDTKHLPIGQLNVPELDNGARQGKTIQVEQVIWGHALQVVLTATSSAFLPLIVC